MGPEATNTEQQDQSSRETIPFDDTELVQQARRGNMGAFEQLIRRYQDRVYTVILRSCSNPEASLDLTQETFLRAIKSLGRFRGQSSFYTWLFRIAMNVTISWRRKRENSQMTGVEDFEQNLADSQAGQLVAFSGSSEQDPANIAQQREATERVLAALDTLEPAQRTIIVLRDIEQMDYASIAEVLNITEGTVKSRLHRSRLALRERLDALSY